MSAYHPDRSVCECAAAGKTDNDECFYSDPCWISRTAYLNHQRLTRRAWAIASGIDPDEFEAQVDRRAEEIKRDLERAILRGAQAEPSTAPKNDSDVDGGVG